MALLKYKQRLAKPSFIIAERFGSLAFIPQSGYVDYDQEEEVADDKVYARIVELKSFSNRKYHSFLVV
jgi:hypothetical protein